MTLSLLAFVVTDRWLAAAAWEGANRAVEAMVVRLSQSIAVRIERLNLIQALFASKAGHVSRAEFRALAEHLAPSEGRASYSAAASPELLAIAWLPRTSADQRQALEAAAHADGLTDFRITDSPRDGDDAYDSPHDGDDAYPVFYVEPMDSNVRLLGRNAPARPELRRVIDAAIAAGTVTASAPVSLMHLASPAAGMVLYAPVFRGGGIPADAAQRARHIQGFVTTAFGLDGVMREAAHAVRLQGPLSVVDVTDGDGTELFRLGGTDGEFAGDSIAKEIAVAGRRWRVVRPLVAGWQERGLPLAVLVLGLSMAGLSTAIVVGAIRRRRDATLAAARLSTAVSLAPITVFNLDRQFRITWVHGGQGGGDSGLWGGANAARLASFYRGVLDRRTGLRGIEMALTPTGAETPRHYMLAAEPILDDRGAPQGLTCAAIDVSDMVEHRDQLRQAKEAAERANFAKSHVLASASHDLRQPLQALRLFVDFLGPRLAGSDNEAPMQQIEQALTSTQTLIEDVLEVSRLEAGSVVPMMRGLDLAPLLEELAEEFRPIAGDKGLAMRAWLPGTWARTDAALVRWMVRNLLANAVRFTEQGGVMVALRRRGSCPVIEVWDTGIGIAADHLPLIWEDLYQVGNFARQRAYGLGIGLSIVRRLGEALGAELDVCSIPARGTVFRVILPAV